MPTMVEVVGTYLDAGTDGAGPGLVSFVPDVVSVNGTAVIVQHPVTAEVAADGTFTVAVVASDDVGWQLSGERMPYIVTENVPGNYRAFMAYVDGPGPVNIADLVPLSEAPAFPAGVDPDDYVRKDWLTYDYSKVGAVNNIPDTWTEINRLAIDRPAGLYVFGVSLTWEYDVTNRSAEMRFSTDNGQTWGRTYAHEPNDATDVQPFYYAYPIDHAGGPRSVIMQARKTAANGLLNVAFCDLWYERRG